MPTSTKRSSPSRRPATARKRRARERVAVFVDSSAWIAFFSASDGKHREADAAFRRAFTERARLVTSNLVVAEVHQILLRRAGIRPARVAIERIAGTASVTVAFSDAEMDRAARRWLDRFADHPLSYTDGTSFALIEALRCGFALTFDGDFPAAKIALWI